MRRLNLIPKRLKEEMKYANIPMKIWLTIDLYISFIFNTNNFCFIHSIFRNICYLFVYSLSQEKEL